MSAWYTAIKEPMLSGQVDLSSEDIRLVLVDTDVYAADLEADAFLDAIPSGARVATLGSAMTGVTLTGGVFDADDLTLPTVTGDSAEAVVLYLHTGTESTSRLLMLIDYGVNLPLTPNGDDVIVQWNPSGIAGF